MKKILIIAKKEWQNYFTSPVGYVFAGLLITIVVWMFVGDMFLVNQADLRSYWSILGFLLSIFVPAISMNLLAEEKKNSTWEVLLSLPISEKELTVGKFLGCALYLIFSLLLSLPIILTILILGHPDIGPIIGGFIGILLLGLSYLSLGLFMSSLSNQSVVGFLGATVALMVNNLLGQESLLVKMPGVVRGVAENLSLYARAVNFFTGLVQIKDLLFFGSWILVFLILTVVSLKARGK